VTPDLPPHTIGYVPETTRTCRNRPAPAAAPDPAGLAGFPSAADGASSPRPVPLPLGPLAATPLHALLTRRRAVDFCRVATAICCR
jgi:hypothetical protein